MVKMAKKLKKEKVNIDIVNFGEEVLTLLYLVLIKNFKRVICSNFKFIEILQKNGKWIVNEIHVYGEFVCIFQQINTDKLTTFINTINGKDGNRYI